MKLVDTSKRIVSAILRPNVIKVFPGKQVVPRHEVTSGWVSVGDAPVFVVPSSLATPLVQGWYMLEVQVDQIIGSSKGLISAEDSNDQLLFSKAFPVIGGKVSKRLIYLNTQYEHLLLRPVSQPGEFTISRFRLLPVSKAFAESRMIKKLVSKQGQRESESDYRGKAEKEAVSKGLSLISYLEEKYEAIFQSFDPDLEYRLWIKNIESPSLPSENEIIKETASWDMRPVISVIVPVFNIEKSLLEACINSVLRQSYPHWELCVSYDCSSEGCVKDILDAYVASDARIKVVYRQENGHISAALNSAISLASGHYVTFLDHDDELAQHALFFVAHKIAENNGVKLIYSDEDKIDMRGKRFSPHFKSGWNPDLLFSQNYIKHLLVLERTLVDQVGGFRQGFEGSRDYDLVLRCLPEIKAEQVSHIPKILYHRRSIEGSTAMHSGDKDYTTRAGEEALKSYFHENGPGNVKVTAGRLANTNKVEWPIPSPLPLVSLIIPTRDMLSMLKTAVGSILEKTTYPNLEIIIIDNESVEKETLDYFKEIQFGYKNIKVISYPKPFNYSAINNYAVSKANGSIIGLVNNDVEVINPEWLTEMVRQVVRPEIGCVGAKLYYSNDQIQHAGVILGIGGVAGHSHKYFSRYDNGYFFRLELTQNLSAVTGACLLVRKVIYEEVGGLDEINLTVAFNDVDFCLEVLSKGYRNLWTPYAELYHHESRSRGQDDTPEKKKRFEKEVLFMKSKWGDFLNHDNYYNENLTLVHEDFSLLTGN